MTPLRATAAALLLGLGGPALAQEDTDAEDKARAFWDEVGNTQLPYVPENKVNAALDDVFGNASETYGPSTGLEEGEVTEEVLQRLKAATYEDEVEPPGTAPPPDEDILFIDDIVDEIQVWGDLEEELREEIDLSIRAAGYQEGVRKGNRTVYRGVQTWRPTVIVGDDGSVVMKRGAVRFGTPWKQERNGYMICPILPVACLKFDAKVVGKKHIDRAKNEMTRALQPTLFSWDEARFQRIHHERLEQLPDRLMAAWTDGASIEGEDLPMSTPQQRKEAILRFWATRADTPEGRDVRMSVRGFLDDVVQVSEAPVTEDEAWAVRDACGCEELPVGWWPAGEN